MKTVKKEISWETKVGTATAVITAKAGMKNVEVKYYCDGDNSAHNKKKLIDSVDYEVEVDGKVRTYDNDSYICADYLANSKNFDYARGLGYVAKIGGFAVKQDVVDMIDAAQKEARQDAGYIEHQKQIVKNRAEYQEYQKHHAEVMSMMNI